MGDKFGQRCRGKTNRPSEKRKMPSDKGPHSNERSHVCDSLRNQIETLKLPNSQNRQHFAKSMVWRSPCILHTILMRSYIHLVQRADCHFPLEIHTLHWPYVLCQTETSAPTFSASVSAMHELVAILLILFSVCAHNVSLHCTTDRQGPCHQWLFPPSGPAIVPSASARLVSGLPPCSWLFFPELTLRSAAGMFPYSSSCKAFLPPQRTSCFPALCFQCVLFCSHLTDGTKEAFGMQRSIRRSPAKEELC